MINKSTIAPIVGAICLAVGTIIGHPIGQSIQDESVTVVVAAVSFGSVLWHIYQAHKKK